MAINSMRQMRNLIGLGLVTGLMAMAGGVLIGFLSHLLLDEIYAVDFRGLRPKLNQFAGSALKFYSKSWLATLFTYVVLGGLGYQYYLDQNKTGGLPFHREPPVKQTILPEFPTNKGLFNRK